MDLLLNTQEELHRIEIYNEKKKKITEIIKKKETDENM